MKSKKSLLASLLAVPVVAFFSSSTTAEGHHNSTQNANGTYASTGAPGEVHTCSQAGCHGAGNGSNSSGGLADNAGPGGITITSVPALTGNQYVPNTLYHISLTVNETGKSIYGFDFESLDNSGQTDLHINNTAGTIIVTDNVRTHTGQAFGTGRLTITHSQNAGLSANSSTFTFDWQSPASGTVNWYSSGVAGNGDNLPDSQDNVYTKYILGLTPATTGIASNTQAFSFDCFPNPVNDELTVSLNLSHEQALTLQVITIDGKLVRTLSEERVGAGTFVHTYSTADLDKGVYLLRITSDEINQCKRLFVN